jgi:hypothetical protein
MTVDVIALCRARPDLEGEIGALLAAGPDLLVRWRRRFPVLELLDENERSVLAVDGPRLVQVPGEVRRLLGVPAADVTEPVWWIEVRASSVRDGELDDAGLDPGPAARRLAEHLIGRYGGFVWPAVADA